MEAIIHYNIVVRGLVQGVSYRAATKTKAQELRLCGLVKNNRDGSVYIEAEGPENKVRELVDWCHYGPPHAKVLSVEIETAPLKKYGHFEVKY